MNVVSVDCRSCFRAELYRRVERRTLRDVYDEPESIEGAQSEGLLLRRINIRQVEGEGFQDIRKRISSSSRKMSERPSTHLYCKSCFHSVMFSTMSIGKHTMAGHDCLCIFPTSIPAKRYTAVLDLHSDDKSELTPFSLACHIISHLNPHQTS